jgi:transposase-like protein
LILDHINGVPDDHRLENLQIVCPNSAATLDTHCGHQNRITDAVCEGCGITFEPKDPRQRYCSHPCFVQHRRGKPAPERRKVRGPPDTHLLREVRAIGVTATGRRYGVSHTTVRKWIRQYERELETLEGGKISWPTDDQGPAADSSLAAPTPDSQGPPDPPAPAPAPADAHTSLPDAAAPVPDDPPTPKSRSSPSAPDLPRAA